MARRVSNNGLTGLATLALVTGLLGCEQAAPPAADTVAVVAGEVISVDDFRAEMRRRGGEIPGMYQTPEQRMELLNALVENRALVARAKAEGYDKDPEVVAVLERMMISKFREDMLKRKLAEIAVSNEQIEAFYQDNLNRYTKPERRQAAVIRISKPANANAESLAELQTRAQRARAEALEQNEHNHFGDLARRYSDDRSSRYLGGSVGWVVQANAQRSRLPESVIENLFALPEEGAISDLLDTEQAFFIVRLMNIDAEQVRPLSDLRDGIRHHLTAEKRKQVEREFSDQIRSDAEVKVNESIVASIGPVGPGAETEVKTPPPLPRQ